jgi:acylphosphatase
VWTRAEADRLGIAGWVRNEKDGSVAAFLDGPDEAVSAMLEALRSGPPGAVVRNVASEPAESADHPAGFRIVG